MARVKIFLDVDETQSEAESDLVKALSFGTSPQAHDKEKFDDPAIQHASEHLDQMQKHIYADMMNEIIEALEAEHE
jgi:hypothetical protein